MIGDRTIRIAGLLVAALPVAVGGAEAHAPVVSGVRYTCSDGQNILVERDRYNARVTFADRSYVLQRKASGIGQKYLARGAALIIDDRTAVFVADDGTDLGNCTEAVPLALAH